SQFSVSTPEEQEWRDVLGTRTLDLADVDRVIARVIRLKDATVDMTHRVIEDRTTALALAISDAFELLDPARGEPARNGLLLFGQNVDAEHLAPFEIGIRIGLLVYADEDQRRDERYGGYGIGCQPERPSRLVARGDHRHTRSEVTHHPAELVLLDRHDFAVL